MAKFKNKYRIESTRLPHYDYSQPGAYFITIVTQNRQCIFGEINNGKMFLNELGEIVKQCWLEIPVHFPNVKLEEFVVMPNHVHGIIIITESIKNKNGESGGGGGGGGGGGVETNNYSSLRNKRPRGTSKTIGSIIRGFKIGVTKYIRQHNPSIKSIWQRNYYEHIIRNDDELNRIRKYINENPLKWNNDEHYVSD